MLSKDSHREAVLFREDADNVLKAAARYGPNQDSVPDYLCNCLASALWFLRWVLDMKGEYMVLNLK